jgi:AcrR family transcriptional regulator
MSKSANKILDTAEYLFNQYSFVGVGVDLIRDMSGCSKTTLYTYFKNKQQLVLNVLKNRDNRFRNSLNQAVGDKTGIEALEQIYNWHINWFKTEQFKGCLFVRAVSENERSEQDIHDVSQQHKKWLYQLISYHASSLNNHVAITDLLYTQIEGLISRFMVEGFNQEIADQQKTLIFKLIDILQTSTE